MNDRYPPELPGEHGRPAVATTCGLATASLVLGVLGMTCFSILTGVPALVLGIVALSKIRKSQGFLAGEGLAIAGIVLGGVSILILPVLAGFMVPTLMRGKKEAYTVQCASNVRQLFTYAMAYSDKKGTRSFPYSPKGSIASLQEMINFDAEGLSPRLFTCPEGQETPADRQPDGRFQLSEETCSYEIVPKKIRNTAIGSVLIYDKAPRHRGSRNVLFTDGTVRWVEEAEFQQLLEKTLGAQPPAKK